MGKKFKRIPSSGSWLHRDTIETILCTLLFKETSFLLFGPLAKIIGTRNEAHKVENPKNFP
jgi:hypothetical protein